jgi:hypothetical protein
MKAECLYCNDILRFVTGHGWVHSDGETYQGTCSCGITARHARAVECPTWRDDHAALRSWAPA